MAKVHRSMCADEDGRPKIGNDAKSLGVRLDGAFADLPEVAGIVKPKEGGMSVSSRWQNLPAHRIPRRLRGKCKKAKGSDDYVCWRMGEGPFIDSPIGHGLHLSIDPDDGTHGFVEPDAEMKVEMYCDRLAATQQLWIVDEE
jgi:hypothetical protein